MAHCLFHHSGCLTIPDHLIIDVKISQSLALGAGLRNILVHDYEDIDYKLLHSTIPTTIQDMRRFMNTVTGSA